MSPLGEGLSPLLSVFLARGDGEVYEKGERTRCDNHRNRHMRLIKCTTGHKFQKERWRCSLLLQSTFVFFVLLWGIAHILGILLMNSCNTDIFFSNYYHLQSVRFDLFFCFF